MLIENQANELDFKASKFNISIEKKNSSTGSFFVLGIDGVNGFKVEKSVLSFSDLSTAISELISAAIGLNARSGCSSAGTLAVTKKPLVLSKRITLRPRPTHMDECPECDFDNEYDEYDFCPDCGKKLLY